MNQPTDAEKVDGLESRLEKAIELKRFNFFEMRGFMDKPRLALMAGAAIGYMQAMKEFKEDLNKVIK